tara:strand:- start:2501 stop:2983 length:483 start_codon:yes stop_codon:yes gene_type:complete
MFGKRGLIFLAITVLLVSNAFALQYSTDIREMVEVLPELEEIYNLQFDTVPSWVKAVIGSEKLNVVIVMNDNSLIHIGILLNSGKIVAMRKGRLKDPTVNVYLKESQIDKVLALHGHKARLKAIKDLYDDDLISYEATSFRAQAKLATVELAVAATSIGS